MICPNCGRDIPAGAGCICGGQPLYSSNPAVNTLKTMGSSNMFLVFAILWSAVPVLSMLSNMFSRNLSFLYYNLFADEFNYSSRQVGQLLDVLNQTSFVTSFVAMIPQLLIVAGIWMFYAACRNRQFGGVSTTGLTICKVILIINTVSLGLVCLAVLIFMGIGVSVGMSQLIGFNNDYAGVILGIVIFLTIILLATFALGIFYLICAYKTVNRIKGTAVTGVPDAKISRFLIVFNYIIAVCSGLSGLFAVFTVPLLGLSSLASGVALFLLSTLLSRYKNQMLALLYPPVQPVYAARPPMSAPGTPYASAPYAGMPTGVPSPIQQQMPVAPQAQTAPVVQPQQEEDGGSPPTT